MVLYGSVCSTCFLTKKHRWLSVFETLANSRDVGGLTVGDELAAAKLCSPQEIPLMLIADVAVGALVTAKFYHQRMVISEHFFKNRHKYNTA